MREEENICRRAEKISPPPPTSPAYKRALPVSLRRQDHHCELHIELEHAVFTPLPYSHLIPSTITFSQKLGVAAAAAESEPQFIP